MPFEWLVAIRFLREGKAQTMLILSGIGVGVGVIIFLSALITGLQQSIIDRTLGTQPHVVVRPQEEMVRQLVRVPGGVVVARMLRPPQRLRTILRWQQTLDEVRAVEGVVAAAPVVNGAAFALRGNANRSVAVRGVEAGSYARIIDMESKIVSGHFDVEGGKAVIGVELAKELGVGQGDKLRLSTPDGRQEVFLISGIFDVGNRDLNLRWVFVSLRAGQTLLDLAGGISTIELKCDDIFDAETVAQTIASRSGLIAESWMKLNSQLLVGLRSQGSSSIMIQFFVVVAVALGIASVLIVSVVQKSAEIGILKAMGTPTRRVVGVFLLQGALLGLVGSILGMLLGTGLAMFFQKLASNPDGSPTFPVNLTLLLYLRSAAIATIVGILAATSPAREAAKLDPAEVIRYG
ncbi:MAG: ABC transporter permease [Thermoanaerobaculia bacterium]|jgi:lipoprotein-releasing system permease protein